MTATDSYDVIVIGGGPAGSTAAALLAEKGRRVLVLEKEKFPRYHIGESLMPFCWFTLERLGVLEEMERIAFTKKYSVQFVTQDGRQSQPFYFFQHYDHPSSTTLAGGARGFRSHAARQCARAKARRCAKQTPVTRVLKDDSGRVIGVEAMSTEGGEAFEVFAPMTIDCSGREQVATARDGWRVKDPQLNKLAIWTYYRGAKRDPGIDEGNDHGGLRRGARLVLVHPAARTTSSASASWRRRITSSPRARIRRRSSRARSSAMPGSRITSASASSSASTG